MRRLISRITFICMISFCFILIVVSGFALYLNHNKKVVALNGENTLNAIREEVEVYTQLQKGESSDAYDFKYENDGSEYAVGKTVKIASHNLSIDGQDYPSQITVAFPDGRIYKTDTVFLEQSGIYTVEYFAVINGKFYSEVSSFKAEAGLCSFNDSASTAIYGVNAEWGLKESSSAQSTTLSNVAGLNVKIAKDDTFKLNKVIDIDNASQEVSLISMYLTPNVQGTPDVKTVYLVFTDAYNENNSITIRMKTNANGTYTFVDARATNQAWAGLQPTYSGGEFSGYKYHINNVYGYPTLLTPGGLEDRTAQKIVFKYDSDNKILYSHSVSNNCIIVDFDNMNYQSNPWSGFSSSKVYFSMYGDDYAGDSLNAVFTEIGDCDLDYKGKIDEQGPTIDILSEGVDADNLPDGGVGMTYTIFDAEATDAYCKGKLAVSRRVFYEYKRVSGIYSDKSREFIYEENIFDGRFTPQKAGKYSVVYSAYDWNGNYTEQVCDINVVNNYEDASYIVLSDKVVTSSEIGNKIRLATISNYGGYVGIAKIDYKVLLNGNEVEIYGNIATGYSFIPKQAGKYEVSVILTDTVGGGASVDYTIDVKNQIKPAFDNDVVLPKYFIQQMDYILPELAARLSDGTEKASEIYIIDGFGERKYNGGFASFAPNNEGNAVIKYVADGNEKLYAVPVVSVYTELDLDLAKYFNVTEGEPEVKKLANGIEISTRETDGNVEFIKDILANKFSLKALINFQKNDFERLYISFTDSEDSSCMFTVEIERDKEKSKLYINGKYSGYDFEPVFYSGASFNVSYNNASKVITDGNGAGAVVEKTFYGEDFNGFLSGKVYVTCGFKGVHSRSAVLIQKMNNQNMNASIAEDKVVPEMCINGKYNEVVIGINDRIKVYSANCGDVLSNIAFSGISVTKGEQSVFATDGTSLNNVSFDSEYIVYAKEYGEYIIRYTVIDSQGRKVSYAYKIFVQDKESPIITVSDMSDKSAKIGDTVSVSVNSTATDNVDVDLKVYIYIIKPDYTVLAITDEGAFFADQKGVYTIRYYAIDGCGNSAVKDYYVNVEG